MFSKTKEPNPLNFFECRKITKKPDGLQMLKINFDHTETSEHMEKWILENLKGRYYICLLYTSPSPRDVEESRMPSSA